MKNFMRYGLVAIFVSGVAIPSIAATSLDLKVSGSIVPPACTPTFASGGGVVDFGNIRMATLSLTKDTALPDIKRVPVVITCQQPARFGLTFIDQRKVSVKSTTVRPTNMNMDANLGLGVNSDNAKIGAYAMGIDEDTLKNKANQTRWVITNNGGSNWMGSNTGDHYSPITGLGSTTYSFTADTATNVPSAEEQIKFDLVVGAVISDLTSLKVKDEVKLDGLTLISLVYL